MQSVSVVGILMDVDVLGYTWLSFLSFTFIGYFLCTRGSSRKIRSFDISDGPRGKKFYVKGFRQSVCGTICLMGACIFEMASLVFLLIQNYKV
jgi:hypothetical protein